MRNMFCFVLVLVATFNVWARPTFAKKGLVVSCSALASQVGADILKQGGNVADAAVATAFALSVTTPYYASLGGGGFLLIRINGKVEALDYRERAPQKSTREMFLGKPENASTVGGLAVCTPGNVKGLFELHKKYGKLPWTKLVLPAQKLAAQGFPVTEEFARMINENVKDFSPGGKKYFTHKGTPLEVGEIFKQPQLARALNIIMRKGASGFYSGEIAADIVDAVKSTGGIMTGDDLTQYKVRWMEPLHAKVFDSEIYSMPPPSSGGALLLSELKISEKVKLGELKAYSLTEYHSMAEIMSRAFFDRQYIADPQFSKFDVSTLFSAERVSKLSETVHKNKKSIIKKQDFEIHEGTNTTHYVVADGNGNTVTATTTVNTEYGSGVFTEKFGINLNNEMDDFTTQPGKANTFGLTQSEINTVAPFKTPLSSMTPTIVEKNGQLFLSLGAPGGPRIINAVYQTIYHALHTNLNLDEIIQMPRVHHQYNPDKIMYDRTLSTEIVEGLHKLGHAVYEGNVARVYAVRVNSDGKLEGAFDSRGEGGIAGY